MVTMVVSLGIERYHFLQLIRHLGAIENLYLLCAHGFTPLLEVIRSVPNRIFEA